MDSTFIHIIDEIDVQDEHMEDCVVKDHVHSPPFISQHLVDNTCSVALEKKKNIITPTLYDFVMPTMRESQLVAIETGQTYVLSLVAVESENTYVAPLIAVEFPGKYAESPYTYLSESGGTSRKASIYCSWKHPYANYTGFNMHNNLLKILLTLLLSLELVARVDLMDWFYPLAYLRKPWGDLIIKFLHVDVIMHYLRKFCKYCLSNNSRVTTTDPFFINWVVQIHDT
ncbi:hypothetical protein R3W88_027124 [Solanum pinnatisectum]|uniref:Uncharacterized protein n=1 Tax=Solanum pinnatisectum TaxID=50273 RepID=A0AAV9LF35_9SOLN|nr:hypothetical protein R3W88_027124 [Solanum pinnatisectum]